MESGIEQKMTIVLFSFIPLSMSYACFAVPFTNSCDIVIIFQ